MRYALENTTNLTIFQQPVSDLLIDNDQVTGVVLGMGLKLHSKTVVITAGTFLAGQIHIGMNQQSGGRAGDPASNDLANSLRDRPFRVARLKTGTPPRIDSRSVDYKNLQEQPGDKPTPYLSMMSTGMNIPSKFPAIYQERLKKHAILF